MASACSTVGQNLGQRQQLVKLPWILEEEDDWDEQRLKFELRESQQGAAGGSMVGQNYRRRLKAQRSRRRRLICKGEYVDEFINRRFAKIVRREKARYLRFELGPLRRRFRHSIDPVASLDVPRSVQFQRDEEVVEDFINRKLLAMIGRHKTQWIKQRRADPAVHQRTEYERTLLIGQQSADWDELRREREMLFRRSNDPVAYALELQAREDEERNELERAGQRAVLFRGLTEEDVDDYYHGVLQAMHRRMRVEWNEEAQRAQRRQMNARHNAELDEWEREHETWLGRLNDPEGYARELEARPGLDLEMETLFRSQLYDPFTNTRVMTTSNLTDGLISRYLKIGVSKDRLADKEQICTICQDDLCENGMNIATLDCRHEYHYSCIKQWLRMKNVCPLCNKIAINVKIDR
ncbi:hypothetical protein CASFOL_038378 [Castilleja foliolosa]|uniref:RING-type E3 ubiquitin transferase n=1 Tax=Castilleja foliolosa TaxID=1961234 RepID=A0ABD3BL90_9LAMI